MKKQTKVSLRRQKHRQEYKQWQSVRAMVLRRDDYKCQICGNKGQDEQGKGLNVHHILDRRHYKDHMYDSGVLLTTCSGCHKFFKLSCHKNALWFAWWLQTYRMSQWSYCIEIIKSE